MITVCTTLTIALAFAVAISQVIVAQNQNQLDNLNRRLDAAQARYERLRYQVAEAESPERIVAAAQERLGMIEPAKVNYVAPVAATPTVGEEVDVTAAPDWRLVKAELAAK
jgi:cell division protein FtsL